MLTTSNICGTRNARLFYHDYEQHEATIGEGHRLVLNVFVIGRYSVA